MMKKITKILIYLAVFSILVLPVLSFSAGLIPCGTDTPPNDHPCEFKDFLDLVNNVIKFVLFKMAVPIAAIMFFYAGFKLVTSGGSTENRGIAKKVFSNTVYGLAVAMAAWIIIRTILLILGYDGDWIGF